MLRKEMSKIYLMLKEARANSQVLAHPSFLQMIDYEESDEDENEQEERRQEIYDQHVKLVDEGISCHSVEWFKRKIQALPLLVDDLPLSSKEGREEDCLFETILNNPFMEKHEKCELLELALDTSYAPYYTLLLTPPLFDTLAMDKSFHPFIRKLYLCLLNDVNTQFALHSEGEPVVWKMFLDALETHTVLHALMQMPNPNHDMLMRYLVFWINQIPHPESVVETCEEIENKMRRKQYMTDYTLDVQKLGKQRILAIEFEKNASPSERTESSQLDTVTPAVTEFLNRHRYSFFFGRFGRTTSTKINNLIHSGETTQAQTMYTAEKQQLENEINTKLRKEPGYHPEFRLG